jgi:HAD superfamily hydrolase (TIGR01509 family)
MSNPPVKNFIFDLGGVILNLDYQKTSKAFTVLGVANFDELYTQSHANPLFQQLECGLTTPAGFIAELGRHCSGEASEEQIINAWNAMLLDFPPQRIQLLKQLNTTYRTFLLSNTNAIHLSCFNEVFQNTFKGDRLDRCFEKAYYSHEIGFRKPNKEAFEFVLNQHGLRPEETIFIDDTLANISAAQTLGLQTIYLKPPLRLEEVLAEYVKP